MGLTPLIVAEARKAILGELTLFHDSAGMVFFDFDDPEKENTETQFKDLEGLEKILTEPKEEQNPETKGGQTEVQSQGEVKDHKPVIQKGGDMNA